MTAQSFDRVRLRWIWITSDVTGCSPAATSSSRCSTRNREQLSSEFRLGQRLTIFCMCSG
jgi:hypothetical protein